MCDFALLPTTRSLYVCLRFCLMQIVHTNQNRRFGKFAIQTELTAQKPLALVKNTSLQVLAS